MAGAVRNLMVRGGADFSKLDKALGRTGKNARSMQSSFDRATKGMQASASRLSGVLSKALALAGVASLAEQTYIHYHNLGGNGRATVMIQAMRDMEVK